MTPGSRIAIFLTIALLAGLSLPAMAQDTAGNVANNIAGNIAGLGAGLPALISSSGADGSTSYSLSLQILALMTAMTLLPSVVLGMTSFTRIIIVLSILRQAMGTQQTPPNQPIPPRLDDDHQHDDVLDEHQVDGALRPPTEAFPHWARELPQRFETHVNITVT